MKIKLKYKKLILIISMFALGIGTLSFSLTNKELRDKEVAKEKDLDDIDKKEPETQVASFLNKGKDDKPQETEDAKEPDLEFRVDSDQDIISLITEYMNVKLEPSIELFTSLVNDVSLIDIDAMERETSIIEAYQNIKTFCVDAPKADVNLVYVYYDIRFLGIETPAPAAARFIVIKEDDKAPYIYNGEIGDETNSFIKEFEQSNAYREFVDDVNSKLFAALERDTDLAEFNSKLNEASSTTEETSSSSEALAETKALAESQESN